MRQIAKEKKADRENGEEKEIKSEGKSGDEKE